MTAYIYPFKYHYIIKTIIQYYQNNLSQEEILATIKEGDVFLKKTYKNYFYNGRFLACKKYVTIWL